MSLKLAHILGNSAFGGDTVYIYSLMEMAVKKGIETELVAGDEEVLAQARDRGLNVVPFREIIRPISPWRDVMAVRKLADLLKCRQYDFVHTHTSKGGAVGRLAARKAGTSVVVHTVQGYSFHEFSGSVSTTAYSRIEKYLARSCDRIISVNEHDREMSLRLGIVSDPKKIVTVYNGVALKRLEEGGQADRSQMLREIGIDQDAVIMVNLARLAPQKAQRFLLDAMPIVLSNTSRDVHLVLVGNGEDEAALKRQAIDLSIEKNVHFLGFRRDGLQWFKIADFSVLSSLWEGHSVTILEAMGVGTPVIATDIKGNRETIDHDVNGLLVTPKDSQSLAEAMLRYVRNPELAKTHAVAAKQKFLNRYMEEHVQENTWAVYRELLKEKRLLSKVCGPTSEAVC